MTRETSSSVLEETRKGPSSSVRDGRSSLKKIRKTERPHYGRGAQALAVFSLSSLDGGGKRDIGGLLIFLLPGRAGSCTIRRYSGESLLISDHLETSIKDSTSEDSLVAVA